MRIWFKHRDKGFLPKNFKHDTPSINPINIDISSTYVTPEGDFK